MFGDLPALLPVLQSLPMQLKAHTDHFTTAEPMQRSAARPSDATNSLGQDTSGTSNGSVPGSINSTHAAQSESFQKQVSASSHNKGTTTASCSVASHGRPEADTGPRPQSGDLLAHCEPEMPYAQPPERLPESFHDSSDTDSDGPDLMSLSALRKTRSPQRTTPQGSNPTQNMRLSSADTCRSGASRLGQQSLHPCAESQ